MYEIRISTPNHRTEPQRSALIVNSRLSIAPNVTQAVDHARIVGPYGSADGFDTVRARVAAIALRQWRSEGGGR
jgi:hypothetical protein